MSIQGKKSNLRPFITSDADPLWESIDNETINKLTGTHADFTRDMIDRYVANQIKEDDDSRVSFIIEARDDIRPVGEVVINDIDPDNRSGSIRISLFYEADFGKGYGSEAMHMMVDYGFRELNLHRISLGVYNFNPRAIHVYEKIGFKKEGVLRDALLWKGEYVDEIIMSILEHEWVSTQ